MSRPTLPRRPFDPRTLSGRGALPRLVPAAASLVLFLSIPAWLAARDPAPAPARAEAGAAWRTQASEDISTVAVGTRVKLFLKGGRELEGEVVEIGQFTLKLKSRFGVTEVQKADLLRWERFRTVAERFEERAATCDTAEKWCDLGDWAQSEGEGDLAERAWREATKLDPGSARARKALGEVEYEGEWMPLADAMKKQGKEFYQGEWRTPEEIARLQAEEEASEKAEKLKGRRELEEEYRGRPWATIDPIETPHYFVHCNSTLDVAQRYADVMEALYARYDSVFPEKPFKRNSREKSTVWIHANHQQFMDWNGVEAGIGGFYRPAFRDVTAYHGSFGTTGSTEEVLAHEGTHQFQGLIFDNMWALPIWFIEGLAVYFGDGSNIGRRKVEINVIPRDRLVGLQEAIQDGSYCNLRQLLRLQQNQFGGFHYGHGWGILFWCLYGHKHGANNEKIGEDIMTDWLLHCLQESKKESFCEYEKMATKFEEILVRHTKKSLEDWETEYKEWILDLPIEQIGKTSGNTWTSAALKLSVTRPSGWQWVKATELASDEVVAAKGAGSQTKRISTYCWPNWQHSDMNLEYARTLAGNIFQDATIETEFAETEVGGYPAVRGSYTTAKRVLKAETTFNEQGQPSTKLELGEPLKCEVVLYGSIDKIYCNVFECLPEIWDAQHPQFQKWLDEFHIDN